MDDYQNTPRASDDLRQSTGQVANTAANTAKLAKTAARIKKGTSAASAATSLLTLKIKLAILAGIFGLFLIISVAMLFPAILSNSLLHQNDPESLSAGWSDDFTLGDFTHYGTYEENRQELSEKHGKIKSHLFSSYTEALNAAKNDLSKVARSNGWKLNGYTGDTYVEITDALAIVYASAYNAKNGNALTAEAFTYYQTTSALKDFESCVKSLKKEPSKYKSYGNAIYGADFLRDSAGNIIITSKTVEQTVDGVTTEITKYYVTPVITLEPTISAIQTAFDIDDIYAPYMPSETTSPSGAAATYADIIYDMTQVTGEFMFPSNEHPDFREELNLCVMETFSGGIGSGVWDEYAQPGAENHNITQVAHSQVGQYGGYPYWSWYGFPSHVEWCACFVSWCADQCGFIDDGIIPKFASCSWGVNWFKNQRRWQPRSTNYTPKAGDIIFFDWIKNGRRDGLADHVGIVSSTAGDRVYTIEGNSGNQCKWKTYSTNSLSILGYGIPNYPAETN